MARRRRLPLSPLDCPNLLPTIPQPANDSHSDPHNDCAAPKKHWYHYLPLCGTILTILAPQPSWLCVLVFVYLQNLGRPGLFITHLLISYTLLFMIFSSLLVCLVRDPGNPSATSQIDGLKDREGLLSDDYSPNNWCRKCWAPKPERAHHCIICGRCVLKLDHHCPWIGAKCIGHRTYPPFVHFLCCLALLATYCAIVSGMALWHSIHNPFISGVTVMHEMLVISFGVVFSLVIGPFAGFHLYLTSTNQTTVENTTPSLLLRHLPRLPGSSGHSTSDPPSESELSLPQRRLVKGARVLIYNVGFVKNWVLTFGCHSINEVLYRVWWGGASPGDGMTFPRNPQSEKILAKLAKELVELELDTDQ